MRLGVAESVGASMMLILGVYIYMHRVVSCRKISYVVWPVIHPSQVSNTYHGYYTVPLYFPKMQHCIFKNCSDVNLHFEKCSDCSFEKNAVDGILLDDPELTHKGQPSVPETLLLLHQKVKHLSKPIQALCDLADILERPTQKSRAMAIMNKISGSP